MGRLDIRIVGARNLENVGIIGKTDSYVKLTIGEDVFQTSLVKNSLHPHYDAIFKFHVDDPKNARLELEVIAKRTFGEYVLGEHRGYALDHLPQGQVKDEWLDLSNCDGNSALHVRFLALDFGISGAAASAGAGGNKASATAASMNMNNNQYSTISASPPQGQTWRPTPWVSPSSSSSSAQQNQNLPYNQQPALPPANSAPPPLGFSAPTQNQQQQQQQPQQHKVDYQHQHHHNDNHNNSYHQPQHGRRRHSNHHHGNNNHHHHHNNNNHSRHHQNQSQNQQQQNQHHGRFDNAQQAAQPTASWHSTYSAQFHSPPQAASSAGSGNGNSPSSSSSSSNSPSAFRSDNHYFDDPHKERAFKAAVSRYGEFYKCATPGCACAAYDQNKPNSFCCNTCRLRGTPCCLAVHGSIIHAPH